MVDHNGIFAQSAIPQEAYVDWERFLETYGAALPSDTPHSFYRLFGNCRFLPRFLSKYPATFTKVVRNFNAKKEKTLSQFEQETLKLVNSSPSPLQDLKLYKYSELIRITMKDLEGGHDRAVLRELSCLAYALLRAVTHLQYEELKIQIGSTPLTSNGTECLFHYLSLGKMGGYELNYSSDIDLLAITETDDGKAGNMSLHEFFVKLTQNVTHALQHKDDIGFFYRVDWDLRPEGKSGTLVNNLSALEYYYETFGAEWERQVFTKASPGAGNLAFGEKFIKIIAPFCYRKTFDLESIRRIQGMKEKIHDSMQSQLSKGFNVKLGIGGIRDIEFFVQAFLMVFGGVKPQIRHISTLEIIGLLCQEKMISDQTAFDLKESYLFLRRLENKLQMLDENQTQIIPNDEDEQVKIAKRLGYLGSDAEIHEHFSSDLKRVTLTVKNIFDGLFQEKKSIESAPPFSLVATDEFAEQIRPNLLNEM
ncbi:MAG: adenylylating enzyme for glutamine synthetase, partial [uncultured bacterium]